jgi:hypothetical protein
VRSTPARAGCTIGVMAYDVTVILDDRPGEHDLRSAREALDS